jgi:hypothetical protein
MPREVDAKKRMRKSYESQTKPQEWARDLGKTIRLEYSHDAIFKKYDELFGKIL